jgi:hypothetical protein
LQISDPVLLGGPSHDVALTGPSLYVTHERSSGPSLTAGSVVPPAACGTTAASDAHPARGPLPGSSPVIGRDAPTAPSRRPSGRGGPPQFPPPPSERSEPSTPRSSSGLRFQALHPFRGLRRERRGSALPSSRPTAGTPTTRQASLDATDRSVAPP